MKKKIINILILLFAIWSVGVSQKQSTDSQLALQYYRNKEFRKAGDIYERLFAKTHSKIYFDYYLDCLKELEDYSKAEKVIKKQIRKQPEDLTHYVEYGILFRLQNEKDKAIAQFTKGMDKIGKNEMQIMNLANAFLAEREFGFAEQTYLKGRKKTVNKFYLQLARVYSYQHEYEKMTHEYINYLDENPSQIGRVEARLQSLVVNDIDDNLRKILKKNLLREIQKKPDKAVFPELLIWLYIQEKEFESALVQAKALDRRRNEEGRRLIELAKTAAKNGFYSTAISGFEYVIDLGKSKKFYFKARFGLLDALYKKAVSGDLGSKEEMLNLEANYQKAIDEFGKSKQTIQILKDLAHLQAFYLDKAEQAKELLENAIKLRGISQNMLAECKLELGDILLLQNQIWDATLIYAEVEQAFKHNPLGHEAKFRAAKLAYYNGDFLYAQAQLDILKASTSKLIANDALELSLLISDNTALDTSTTALKMFADTQLLVLQNKDSLAINKLDSILQFFAGHSLSDDIYFCKAKIMRKHRNFKEEVKYLTTLIENYGYDILADNATFRLAEIYQHEFDDKEKAMELYKKILIDFQGSILVTEARKRFRALRGDKLTQP